MVMTQPGQNSQILIVEDDDDTSEMVCSLLAGAGYSPVAVTRGDEALQEIANQMPDLVLLDINLPDVDGLDILRTVREQSFLPMIVISGNYRDKDKVMALEAGADDFLSKPFSPDELIARVKALLRRIEWTPKPDSKLVVRQLELDIPRRYATIRGKKLHLTPIEYGILVTLMRKAGEIITHDEMLQHVWGDQYTGDHSVLRVNISRLRQKLEDNPRRPAYIVTVPGQGYRMPVGR